MQDNAHKHNNRLAGESSPYLLQHAHNPVDWYPWGDEAFEKARAEKKLVLVSIGYSSCHWCHVMERESFENDTLAALLNKHFVAIKVDREERPDVDQVYMTAVQLMTGRGGWPLNCFTLPDGRPVYGGTYFPPEQWSQVLQDLAETWKRDPQRILQYAEKLHEGVVESDLVTLNEEPPAFTRTDLEAYLKAWKPQMDQRHGGMDRAPKFPMPDNYRHLLANATLTNDEELHQHVRLTLDRMALGGIRDQVGGGFARYSTDVLWKVPHFEKMLYDNAQLVSLYSQAYQAYGAPLYREVVTSTLEFIAREMTAPDGAFHSALDADTEGEEGKFYVWTKEELMGLLGAEYDLAAEYFNVNEHGHWESGNHILLRRVNDATFAAEFGIGEPELKKRVDDIRGVLLKARNKRPRPGLDDKALTSWSALMVTGYCDAYAALGDPAYLKTAEKGMDLILDRCRRSDGGLWHSYKDGRASINGYLEDYCFTIEALEALYGITFDERWLHTARELTEYAIDHFMDEESGMFFFTSDLDPPLIARKADVTDNVIPSSNASMAMGLFLLGHHFAEDRYHAIAKRMLNNMKPRMASFPTGYSRWAGLMLAHVHPFHEIVITGPEAIALRKAFGAHYIPNRLFAGGTKPNTLPLLEDRFLEGSTIFVCEGRVCKLPVSTVEEALSQLR